MPQNLPTLVRQKYPGVYDDLDDATLDRQVRAKFPGVYDDIPAAGPTAPAQPQQSTMAGIAQGGVNFLKGIGSSVVNTAVGLGELVHEIPGVSKAVDTLYGTPGVSQASFPAAREAVAPTTGMGQTGKVMGDIAQFFVPAGNVARGRAALKTGKGLLDTILGAGLEGVAAGGVDAAQRGTLEGVGTTAGVAAGATAGMSAGLRALRPLGQRVEQALIKPSIADVKNGFKVDNVFKYDLGGSLTQTYDKAAQKLSSLTDELNAALRAPDAAGVIPQVDVLQAITDTATDLANKSARNFGQNAAIGNAVDKLLEDPVFQTIAQTGKVDVAVANQIKQAVGEMGAWLHNPAGKVVSDADKAMETVANEVYRKLKLSIERSAAGPVGAINRQIADIIPIQQAIIRRLPVEQRQNVINLGDMIGFSTGAWGIALANRLLRSGQMADKFVGAAAKAPEVGAATGALAGAGTSEALR